MKMHIDPVAFRTLGFLWMMLAAFAAWAALLAQWHEGAVPAAANAAVGLYYIWRAHKSAEEDDRHCGCDKCGYNLWGNVNGICPECGTPICTADPEHVES